MMQTFQWLQSMLRISLAPALPEGTALPQIVCYDELEAMDTMMWLGMQNVIIVNDRSSPCCPSSHGQLSKLAARSWSWLSAISLVEDCHCRTYRWQSLRLS